MTDKINIRYATLEDCETLAEVFRAVVQDIPYYNSLARQKEIAKFKTSDLIEKIEVDNRSIILATSNAELMGFCFSAFDDYLIWLEWFGVSNIHRGKGISHLLLTELDKTVVERQCHKIWCDCRTSNTASIHILTHHGYRQVVTIPNHWYKEDFIIWEKEITG